MSKRLTAIRFDVTAARQELKDFKQLLDSKQWLSEKLDIQPFFYPRTNLCACIGFYNTYLPVPDMVVDELVFQGDFRCDLAVGRTTNKHRCFVELEDATEFSIFEKSPRAYRPFSARYEHGVSQIIDWCYKIDDMRSTIDCENIIGCREPDYVGVLVMGRSQTLSASERDRFNWRGRGLSVRGHSIFTITFDDLYDHINERLNLA